MGKSSQRKGRAGEIEIVKILNCNGISAEPGQAERLDGGNATSAQKPVELKLK